MELRPLAAASLFVLAACAGGEPAAAPTPCSTPSAVTNLDELPKELPFEEWGTITRLERDKGFVVVEVVDETTVVELHPKIASAIIDAGYEIVGADNEGFESEIFFAPGEGLTGLFRLRERPCKGLVTATLLFGNKP